MMNATLILFFATVYAGLLFAVAYYADERAERGRSIIGNPYIYALSLAVYCTAWTFYGSVGRAASSGMGFLPIYLGPTLVALIGWIVIRKMVRISRTHRITSISDFISSRYGKSARLAAVVTVVAVLGVVPYIALQLKAISSSYQVLVGGQPGSGAPAEGVSFDPLSAGEAQQILEYATVDTALWASLFLAVFAILFGTRHLDVTERHEGLVAAIAFESLVKLVAFLAVGAFVTFGMYDGPGDLFRAGAQIPDIRALYSVTETPGSSEWMWLTTLSMLAFLLLPRQFQVSVVENVDERHIQTATWLFPLYLLAINLFVLPIAVAGLLQFGGSAGADTFVLSLPLAEGQSALAVFAFLGGLSAATGMVIVAATALSTMISNDLVMPVLLRIRALRLAEWDRLPGLILGIRRTAIVLVLLFGYAYLQMVGDGDSLVSIGLISFVAVAQFAPAFLGGMYWRRGTKQGALTGLLAGFFVWGFTLPLPSLVSVGVLPESLLTDGLFGVAALRPYALFGLDTLSQVPHAMFWSLLVNTGLYAGVSLFSTPSLAERSQAHLFVEVFHHTEQRTGPVRRASASVADLRAILHRFLGRRRTEQVMTQYAQAHDVHLASLHRADETLVHHAEKALAGAIGASSAEIVISSAVQEAPLQLHEVMDILDEAQQVLAYSRELERKRAALEHTTRELQGANEELQKVNHELQQVDRRKDDFVSTVSHELRTPLTAIRAITEILHTNPSLGTGERDQFLQTVRRETERLTRLVNQVLDLQRLEVEPVDLSTEVRLDAVVRDAVSAMGQALAREDATLSVDMPPRPVWVHGDRDRLMQVLLNLLSNASRFCDGRVAVRVDSSPWPEPCVAAPDDGAPKPSAFPQILAIEPRSVRRLAPADAGVLRTAPLAPTAVRLIVEDNGCGIAPDDQEMIFEKFRQVRSGSPPRADSAPPGGAGLGLAIVQQIVHGHRGVLRVDSEPGQGARFSVYLPEAHIDEPSDASPASGEAPRRPASTPAPTG